MDAMISEQKNLQPIQYSYISEFVAYIDRGQRTTQTYITNLKQFAAWLRYEGISTPQRKDIIAYRNYLTVEHDAIRLDSNSPAGWAYRMRNGKQYTVKCKPNTAAQYLRSVRQFFSWLSVNGYYPNIAENIHAPKVKQDQHRKEALSATDVLNIENDIKAAAIKKEERAAASVKDTAGKLNRAEEQGKRLYAMYMLAVTAGLRTVEISRANIADLEERNGQAGLYVWGKGHTEADTLKPLAPEVYAAIRDYISSRTDPITPDSPLFVSTGNRSGGKRIAPTTISKMLKKAMQHAGYDSDRITAHSLRHTAGTNVQELTGNLYLTQKYMRHANPATTEIYLHNDTEKQEADIAERLYSYYHGQEPEQHDLNAILQTMNPDQIKQLTNIAEAMTK